MLTPPLNITTRKQGSQISSLYKAAGSNVENDSAAIFWLNSVVRMRPQASGFAAVRPDAQSRAAPEIETPRHDQSREHVNGLK